MESWGIPSGRYTLGGSMLVEIERDKTRVFLRMQPTQSIPIIGCTKTDAGWEVQCRLFNKQHTISLTKAPTQ